MVQEKEAPNANGLKRSIGLVEVTMLGAGAAIGVSIFSVLAPAAKVGGSGILLSAIFAALPMAVFATVYAFMASVQPKSGASYEWPREFISPFAGFMVAWLRILGSVGVLITLALVFVQYLSMALSVPVKPTMFALLLAIFLLNLRGIRISATAQSIAMGLLLLIFGAFVGLGAPYVRLGQIGNPLAHGITPVLTAVPLMIPLFLGIETSVEVGEEVKNAREVVPRALAIALLLTLIVYLSVAGTALGLLGPRDLAASAAPLIEAGRVPFGKFSLPVILCAASIAIAKSLNSIFIVFSRYLFAMARAKVLPEFLGRVHKGWGTPHMATTAAFLCAVGGLLLPKDLVFLFVAISIPTVIKYMSTCVCAGFIARGGHGTAATSHLNVSPRTVTMLAVAGVACAIVIFALGFEADWRPYVLIAGWGAMGALYWSVWLASPFRKRSRVRS